MCFLPGTSLAEILKYRKQFYEGNYDLRVICERSETPESISSKVINSVNSLTNHNGFISTRHRKDVVAPEKRFLDVVLEGLAPDGGLFVPNHGIPRMTLGRRIINMINQKSNQIIQHVYK